MSHLSNQVILLTGASKGIGRAMAVLLASHGAKLALTARNETELQQLQADLKAQHPALEILLLPADLLAPGTPERLVAQAVAHFGRLDVLINNAGIGGKVGLLSEMPDEQLGRMIATNLQVPLLLCKYALAPMVAQGGGTILTVNSVAGKTAFAYWAVYDATKAGLKAATEALLAEQRGNNIRLINLYPGATATAIWDSLDLAEVPEAEGMLSAQQVAEAAVFALSQPQNVLISDLTIEPTQPAL